MLTDKILAKLFLLTLHPTYPARTERSSGDSQYRKNEYDTPLYYLFSLCVGKTLLLPSPSLHVSCLLICRPVIKIIIQAGITRDAKRKYFTSLSSVQGEILQFQQFSTGKMRMRTSTIFFL